MTTGGYTAQGFLGLTIQEVSGNITTSLLGTLDPALDTSNDEPIGQIIGAFSEQLSSAWGVLGVLYNILNPAAAEGPPLYAIGAITGAFPQQATYSTVVANATLASGASLPTNTTAWIVGQPTNLWKLTAGITNPGGDPAAIPGTWQAVTPGAVPCNSGTLTQFTSTSGWSALTNPNGATVGLNADTATTFRIRRIQSLAAGGSCTVDAIISGVSEVPGVVAVNVFENTSYLTAIDGTPPGGVHVIVWDGAAPLAANNAIAQAIWNNRGAGTATFGATSGTATDARGVPRLQYFDRATQVPIYVVFQSAQTASLTVAQKDAITTAVVEYVASLAQNMTVVRSAIDAAVWALGIYTASPTIKLGIAPSPSGTADLGMSALNIATIPAGGGPYVTFT
jgi:hypothetical protein